ncbi:MAG: hypothetical protein GY778_04945 [bacterium]|nr:hypothetical protein [bacterium]
MNRPITATLSLMALASAGCLGPIGPRRTPQLTITGLVAKPDPGESYCLVEVGSINLSNESVKVSLDPLLEKESIIETQQIVKMRASMGVEYFYNAFFGPTPDTLETAVGWFKVSSLYFHLCHGWVYLTGVNPTVETSWVTAGADGSTLLVHITEDEIGNEVHRVYFVEGSSFWAKTATDQLDDWNGPGTYVDVSADGEIPAPRAFINPVEPLPPAAVLDFYNEVVEIERGGS